MTELFQITIILVGIVGFASFSRRLEGSILTLPMFFTAFGWLIGRSGTEIVPMNLEHEIIHTIAENHTDLGALFGCIPHSHPRACQELHNPGAHAACRDAVDNSARDFAGSLGVPG